MRVNKVSPEEITAQLEAEGINSEPPKQDVAEQEVVEEVKPEEQTVEQEASEDAEPEMPTISVEEKALAQGWNPKGPKSAERWLEDGKLYDLIKRRGKENQELKVMVEELHRMQSVAKQKGYEQALDELKQQKRDAISMGDVAAVEAYDDEINKYYDEQQEAARIKEFQNDPATKEFMSKWGHLTTDNSYAATQLKEFAAQREAELLKADPNLTPKALLTQIEQDVYDAFPSHRLLPRQPEPQASPVAVSQPEARPARGKRIEFAHLSDDQKKAARGFEKMGVMTIEQYIDSLKELGEI